MACVAGLFLAAGCSDADGLVDGRGLPEHAEVQLHPEGDPGQWFSEDYGRGVEGSYGTSDVVCGISDGVVVESRADALGGTSVRARDLITGTLRWELPDLSCAADSVVGGELVAQTTAQGDEPQGLQVVTVGTALEQRKVAIDPEILPPSVLMAADEITVVSRAGGGLLAFDAAGILWQREGRADREYTALGDGHIGVTFRSADAISIIDGRTGDEVMPRTSVDVHAMTWASDGYVQRVNESDPEYAFFDRTGAEVDRTRGESQFSFAPRPDQGATFPLADHLAAGTVTAVDAGGSPVVSGGASGHGTFLRGGKLREESTDLLWPTAVSQEGSLILSRIDDAPTIFDERGEAVHTWTGVSDVRVMGGFLVAEGVNSTQVLIPADA